MPQKHNDSELEMLYFKDNDLFFKYRHPINNIQGKYCYYTAYCKVQSKIGNTTIIDNIFKIEKHLDGVIEETTLIEQDKDGYEKRTLLNKNGAITEDAYGVAIYRLKQKDGSSSVWDVFCYNRYDKLIEDNTYVAQ
ncbi:hypothetical protein AGMMS50262_21140 [Bacteroidia bacterium]|nr:hypothetical protein AGMMS50262_21140 [Bacteroidia bacterium]